MEESILISTTLFFIDNTMYIRLKRTKWPRKKKKLCEETLLPRIWSSKFDLSIYMTLFIEVSYEKCEE